MGRSIGRDILEAMDTPKLGVYSNIERMYRNCKSYEERLAFLKELGERSRYNGRFGRGKGRAD